MFTDGPQYICSSFVQKIVITLLSECRMRTYFSKTQTNECSVATFRTEDCFWKNTLTVLKWSHSKIKHATHNVQNLFCTDINKLEDKLLICSLEVFTVHILKMRGNMKSLLRVAPPRFMLVPKKYYKVRALCLSSNKTKINISLEPWEAWKNSILRSPVMLKTTSLNWMLGANQLENSDHMKRFFLRPPSRAPPSQPASARPSFRGIIQSDHCSPLLSLLSCQHEVWGHLGSRRRLLLVPAAHALHPLPAEGHPPSSLPPAQLCLGYAPSPLCQPRGHSLAPRSLSTAAAGWGCGLLHGWQWQWVRALHWGMDLRPIPVHFHYSHRGRPVVSSCLTSFTSVWQCFFIHMCFPAVGPGMWWQTAEPNTGHVFLPRGHDRIRHLWTPVRPVISILFDRLIVLLGKIWLN